MNHKLRVSASNAAIAASIILAGIASPAFAQDSAEEANSQQGLGSIIVTASRRPEDVQSESRAIAVLGADQLVQRGVTDPQGIQDLVAGLTINRNAAQLQISIRGVGDRTITAATDPAVAFSLDGVYLPRSYQASGVFFDLERVEVLKGPQGTLYGRNASAGAVNLIAAKPDFVLGGFAEFEAGNYNSLRGTAAINLPLNDIVAVRVSGQVIDRDGYLSDGYNDDVQQSLRAQILIEPTPDTSVLLAGSYSHIGGKGTAATIMPTFGGTSGLNDPANAFIPMNPWAGPTDPQTLNRVILTNGLDPDGDPLTPRVAGGNDTFPQSTGYQDLDVFTFAASFEHQADWGTIFVQPSFVASDLTSLNWAPVIVGGFNINSSEQLAIEARISSPAGSGFKWVVGGFAAAEDIEDYQISRIPLGLTPVGPLGFIFVKDSARRDDRTWALFAETSYPLADDLRVVLGGRYTWEKKITDGFSYNYAFPFGPPPPAGEVNTNFPLLQSDATYPTRGQPGTNDIVGTRVDRAFNFRAGLEYDLSPDSMVYGMVSSGFKAGGFFDGPNGNNAYDPEKLVSYQIGTKNRFLNDTVQVNIEGFFWDYTNKQETFLGFIPPIGNVLQTRNAGSVTMYGFDADLAFQPTDNDTFSVQLAYLHSKYDVYNYNVPLGPGGNTGTQPFTACAATPDGNGNETIDCSGLSLVRAPTWSGTVAYNREQEIGNAGSLVFNAQMNFSSGYWLTNDFTPLVRHPAYQTFDASLGWLAPDENISVTAWIKNIGNEAVYHGGVQSATIADVANGQIGAPRTYGVRARMEF